MLELADEELGSQNAELRLAAFGCDAGVASAIAENFTYLTIFSCPDAPMLFCAAGVTTAGYSVGGVALEARLAILKLVSESEETQGWCEARSEDHSKFIAWRLDGSGATNPERQHIFPTEEVKLPKSTGLAAHYDLQTAISHGAAEIFERLASFQWWDVGKPGRRLELGMEEVLGQLLEGRRYRPPILIALSDKRGPPVAACVSFDEDGGRFACGTACAETWDLAAQKAYQEMAQVEAGQWILSEKLRLRGPDALTDADRMELLRQETIRARTFLEGAIAGDPFDPADHLSISDLTTELLGLDEDAFCVELGTATSTIRVVKVIAPSLMGVRKVASTGNLQGVRGTQLW